MIETVQIKLIVKQPLKVGDKEVRTDNIESIEIGDNYRVTKINRGDKNEN